MKSRILFILLGLAIFFCSTPFGMAQEVIREEVLADFFVGVEDEKAFRAEFFAAEEAGSEEDWQFKAVFCDAGLVQLADCGADGESGVDGEENAKRESKRTLSHKIFTKKCRVLSCLSAEKMSKGVAKHPATQDAGQERTAAVRFLRIAALAC